MGKTYNRETTEAGIAFIPTTVTWDIPNDGTPYNVQVPITNMRDDLNFEIPNNDVTVTIADILPGGYVLTITIPNTVSPSSLSLIVITPGGSTNVDLQGQLAGNEALRIAAVTGPFSVNGDDDISGTYLPIIEKGAVNGVASLDGTGKVPASQLPSYVDDVLEFANLAAFPGTGETGKIYVALDTNKTYRWSGSVYVEIAATQPTTLTGDVTGSGTGSFAATISANAVTNAKLAQMAANTVKVNATASTTNAQDLVMGLSTMLARLASGNIVAATPTQITALLNVFTSVLKGLVPASGGGTTNFLRADGTWNAIKMFNATVTPAQITANQNDYAPAGLAPGVVLRLDLNSNREITGFSATDFAERDLVLIVNISTFNLKLKNNNAASLAANRILLDGDLTLRSNMSALLIYDAVSLRFRVVSIQKA